MSELGRDHDRTVGGDGERERADHRGDLERAVEVRELLAVRGLPPDRRGEPVLADREQHEIAAAPVESVRGREPLPLVGQMDEALGVERGRVIRAGALRGGPPRVRRDVEERHAEEVATAAAGAVREDMSALPLFYAARRYGLLALERALDGITGTTAMHICFGYAAIIHERPTGYSFLGELAASRCTQISVETAQAKLDTAILAALGDKQIMVGCLDLADPAIETPEVIVARIERALVHVPAERIILAPDWSRPRTCFAPGRDRWFSPWLAVHTESGFAQVITCTYESLAGA